eukprot:15152232-Heterocapsa_arctica.AAC.1
MTTDDDNYSIEEERDSNWLFMIEELEAELGEVRNEVASASSDLNGNASAQDGEHDLTKNDDDGSIIGENEEANWVFNIEK